jgi:hypothetical protein
MNKLEQVTKILHSRKRRLREKLDKLDLIRYAPAIRAVQEEMKRRVMEGIERDYAKWRLACRERRSNEQGA